MDKDIELYGLVPDGKTTWRIVNEDNVFIIDINDYDVEGTCESIRNRDDIEKYSAEEFIERAWEELRDFFSPHISYCEHSENWDKFCSWFNYLVIEYFTNELSIMYAGLLNFE